MKLNKKVPLALVVSALLIACGAASDRASQAVMVDVAEVPVGQCRIEASGAATLARVVAGNLIRHADGGRIIQAASPHKEDHYAGVQLSIPPAANPGTYTLGSFEQAVAGSTISGYGAALSRQVVGDERVVYAASSGQIVWQDNPFRLRAEYTAQQEAKTVTATVVCNELPETRAP